MIKGTESSSMAFIPSSVSTVQGHMVQPGLSSFSLFAMFHFGLRKEQGKINRPCPLLHTIGMFSPSYIMPKGKCFFISLPALLMAKGLKDEIII